MAHTIQAQKLTHLEQERQLAFHFSSVATSPLAILRRGFSPPSHDMLHIYTLASRKTTPQLWRQSQHLHLPRRLYNANLMNSACNHICSIRPVVDALDESIGDHLDRVTRDTSRQSCTASTPLSHSNYIPPRQQHTGEHIGMQTRHGAFDRD